LTIDYKDKPQETLPRILPDAVQDLEYLLMSRIVKLAREKKPKISLFAPLGQADVTPEMRGLLERQGVASDQFQDAYSAIGPLLGNNGYATERVALTRESRISADTDVLLVFRPGRLEDRPLYEINRFLSEGGAVLIAAQGFEYGLQMPSAGGVRMVPQRQDLSINKLLAKWGLKIDDQMLFDESNDIITITTGERVGPFTASMPVRLPNQILVGQEFMNRRLPLMSRQAPFLFLWGSCLTVATDTIKEKGLDYDILFTSSKRSWRAPYAPGLFGTSPVPEGVLTFPEAGSPGKLVLGMMVKGTFSNTFAESDIPVWPSRKEAGEEAPAADAPQEKAWVPAPGTLVVIGSSKVFSDSLISNRANLNLFANLIDGLALGEDLIQIRAKTQGSRQIKRLTDAQKVAWRLAGIALVPVFWAGFAFARLFLRRKERQFYLQARRS
jgi:ABC-2 type transport system permease protein